MTVEAHTLAANGEISLEELRRRLDDPTLLLIDVRTSEAYAEAHIPGALSLPLAELRARAAASLPNLSAEIAVYCAGPT